MQHIVQMLWLQRLLRIGLLFALLAVGGTTILAVALRRSPEGSGTLRWSWPIWVTFVVVALCAGLGLLVATRLDFVIAVASVALVLVMGGLAGIAAGFFGGWTDRIVGRISDTIMAFPLFVLAMGIVAALGNTVTNIVIATAIINFPLYVRVARAEANVRRDAGFVQAARLSGNNDFRIVLVHILPNIMPIMMVQISLTMGYAILNAAGLSFIGLGVKPPTPEWGIMVAEGATNIISGEWWIAFFPGGALMIAVFCFNLLGDGLRDLVDPQRRT